MKIRIENDIILDLTIFRPGNLPEDLSDVTDMKVILTCAGKEFTPAVKQRQNNVTVYFIAGAQKELGFYKLTLQYSKPDSSMPDGKATYTVDYCDAFKVVANSCEADEVPEIGVHTLALSMTVDRALATGTSDYAELNNKPSINGIELSGNKSLEELGIRPPDLSGYDTSLEVDEKIKVAGGDYISKEGYVTYTEEEKEKLASLQNYDDNSISSAIALLENTKANKTSVPELKVLLQAEYDALPSDKLTDGKYYFIV